MNKEQLIDRLSYFLEPANNIGAVLYFVLEQDGETIIRFANLDNNTQMELKNRFLESITEKFIDNEELHFLNISEADERKNVVYRYDVGEKPANLNILDEILANEVQPPFRFNRNNLSDIKGYLITIGDEGNRIALYKKQYPVNLLKRDRFLLVQDNQRFSQVQGDTLAIDKNFDFMMVDDDFIVLNINTLERFFGFEQVVRDLAQHVIDSIETGDLLEDIEELQELAKDLSNAGKLMKARNSPVLDIPVGHVINFIRNHSELKKKIKLNDGETKIRLTTGVSRKLFLKLLNDDFLLSELTRRQYDSHTKDVLKDE